MTFFGLGGLYATAVVSDDVPSLLSVGTTPPRLNPAPDDERDERRVDARTTPSRRERWTDVANRATARTMRIRKKRRKT
jgi:hypothetical protein